MSRGGRELFHTNFLAYILEIESTPENLLKHPYTLAVKRLVIEQLFSKGFIPENVIAFRERKSLDLVIMPDPDCESSFKVKNEVIVIEAKLKSIPTAEQLKKYDEKLAKGLVVEVFDTLTVKSIQTNVRTQVDKIHYRVSTKKKTGVTTIDLVLKDDQNEILKKSDATLKKFLLAPSDISLNHAGWTPLDWENLLEQITPTVPASNELLDTLVKDYLESTKNILKLVKEVSKETDKFLSGYLKFKSLNTFLNQDNFRGARVHDLVGKIAYFKLQQSLHNDLEQNYQNSYRDFTFDSFTFYSRSTPGFVIQFKKTIPEIEKTSVKIGVQIQGNQYRHFIEREGLDDANPSLDECAESIKEWMNSIPKVNLTEKFGAFNRARFIHRSTKIDDNFEYADLKKQIANSLGDAIKNLQPSKSKDFISDLLGNNS